MENKTRLVQGVFYLWSVSFLETGQFDEAARLLTDMVKNDAADYYPHHELAMLHLKKKEYDLAEIEYRQAVQLEPKGGPYSSLMQVTMAQSTTPSSMNDLYLQFGRVLFHNLASKGEFEEDVRTGKYTLSTPIIAELIHILDKTIELNPTNCRRAFHQRAYVSFIARDYSTALSVARMYITLYSEDVDNAGEIQKARIMSEDCLRFMR